MDRLPFLKLEILVLKKGLPVQEVPEKETGRLWLLDCLIRERASLESEGKNAKDVIAMCNLNLFLLLCDTFSPRGFDGPQYLIYLLSVKT